MGDVKAIKSGNKSAPGSEIYENQSIVYKSACIGAERIIRTLSHTYIKDSSHIHSWNDEDHAFDYQLDHWGVDRLFQNSYEVIIKRLQLYIEDREK